MTNQANNYRRLANSAKATADHWLALAKKTNSLQIKLAAIRGYHRNMADYDRLIKRGKNG